MVLRGFQELDIDRYMNSVNDFRKISPILETLSPDEQIQIREKALAFLQRNPEKRNEIAAIPLENGDTFFQEIVLEAQLQSYKEKFLNRLSQYYQDMPEVMDLLQAILDQVSLRESGFDVKNFDFTGINEMIRERNKNKNPKIPEFE